MGSDIRDAPVNLTFSLAVLHAGKILNRRNPLTPPSPRWGEGAASRSLVACHRGLASRLLLPLPSGERDGVRGLGPHGLHLCSQTCLEPIDEAHVDDLVVFDVDLEDTGAHDHRLRGIPGGGADRSILAPHVVSEGAV